MILWGNIENITFYHFDSDPRFPPFLAHLSRRLIGELIVYKGIRRPSTFSNDISSEAEKPILFIFSSPEPLGSQGELIVYPSSRRPSVVNNFKYLLRNRWADQSQILFGASLGRGNDILFAASGSHDQDGRHAHIW